VEVAKIFLLCMHFQHKVDPYAHVFVNISLHFSGHFTLAGAEAMQTNAQPKSFRSHPLKLYGHTELYSTVSFISLLFLVEIPLFDSITMAGTTTAAT